MYVCVCVCVHRGAVAQQTLQQGQRSMHMAAVVVLLVNAEEVRERGAGVSKRELALASDVIKEGRALLIVANKLDACSPSERIEASGNLVSRELAEHCRFCPESGFAEQSNQAMQQVMHIAPLDDIRGFNPPSHVFCTTVTS